MDPVENFVYGNVLTAPSPADSGTSLVLESGDGSVFPDPSVDGEYNIVVWPADVRPTEGNAEICRVTAKSTDTLTITRTQEGTATRFIQAGDQVAMNLTAKMIGDIETYVDSGVVTFTNKTFDANDTGNSLSNVETADIASGSKSGIDPTLLTGTPGTSGNVPQWDANGDLIDGKALPSGDIVGTTDTQTLTNKTGHDNFTDYVANEHIDWTLDQGATNINSANIPNLPSSAIDAIGEIDTSLRAGSDPTLLTGTPGTNGDLAKWDGNGDLIDGPTPPSGAIVGTTDTQTLTNKTIDTPTFIGVDGWVDANESWSYSSWDDTNGVSTAEITVPSDATTKYQEGMRVKFSQPTDGTKYGIITKVASTTLTVFINTDYDFDNEAVNNPYYSPMKAPFGFALDPDKYAVEKVDTVDRVETPSQGSWTNYTNLNLDVPIGRWRLKYSGTLEFLMDSPNNRSAMEATLSKSTSSEDDKSFTHKERLFELNDEIRRLVDQVQKEKTVSLTTKDTYYVLAKFTRGIVNSLAFYSATRGGEVLIRAECAYL